MPYGLPDSWGLWAARRTFRYVGRRGNVHTMGSAVGGLRTMTLTYKFGRLKLYHPQFDIMTTGENGMVGRYVKRVGRAIVFDAKLQVGVKTGKLRESITMRHTTHKYGHKLIIGSRVSYAYLHHEGSRAHIITPNKAPNLVFRKGPRVIVTKLVHHPGTKPNRYLSEPMEKHVRL